MDAENLAKGDYGTLVITAMTNLLGKLGMLLDDPQNEELLQNIKDEYDDIGLTLVAAQLKEVGYDTNAKYKDLKSLRSFITITLDNSPFGREYKYTKAP